MAELLLELLSEEIPARMQVAAANQLKASLLTKFSKAGLHPTGTEAFSGPRRLVFIADGLPVDQPDILEELKGPRIGAPDAAIDGFVRAHQLKSIDQAEVRKLDKGSFYFVIKENKGAATLKVLEAIVLEAIQSLVWPKSMTWGTGKNRWVRPLKSILCIFDGKVVGLEYAGIKAGNISVGHRFHSPSQFSVSCFSDYFRKTKEAKVMIDQIERRQSIIDQVHSVATNESLCVPNDMTLVDEVSGLVEWPVALLGTIDKIFMTVPREVLVSAMKKHQKYFSLENSDGSFSNRYIVVANIAVKGGGQSIILGNDKVLRARLADAKFFWDQDRQTRLDSRLNKLGERVYQADLGSIRDKTCRIQTMAPLIAKEIGCSNIDQVERAAILCKADLSTGMVSEFPDLQGVIGKYYARNDGEDPLVCDAIALHYSPLGPSDVCPNQLVAVSVALADKLDTLVGFFGMGLMPSSSKDPFALRRAALGVIRLIMENQLRIPLANLLDGFYKQYEVNLELDRADVVSSLLAFLADRLKVHLKDSGIRHDLISAIFDVNEEDDFVRLVSRVSALDEFLASDNGSNLLVAYKRATNMVKIEDKKCGPINVLDNIKISTQPKQFAELLDIVATHEVRVSDALAREDYKAAMINLAELRFPLDNFFDSVTINDKNSVTRLENLGLLKRIGALMDTVATFSNVES